MGEHVPYKDYEALLKELEEVRYRLEEATETIEAIRTGQVDALIVQGDKVHQLYTLRTADQTYRLFIEKMTEGAVTLNLEGIVLFCNTQFGLMTGADLSRIPGMKFIDFVAEEDRELYLDLFENCSTGDCKGEVSLDGHGKRMPVQLSFTMLEMEDGMSLSIIITDLTAQKVAQEQLKVNNRRLAEANHALEESNHDLQQFASVASHDLQEPLRKIQIFSNLLKEARESLTPDAERYLDKIIDSSGRMRTLIIDILNYSRLSATDIQWESVDLNVLVKELKEDLELIIDDKKAQVITSELPVLVANKGQIRQVFHNILNNALKFSKAETPPVVRITYKKVKALSFDAKEDPEGKYYLISVTDNGIGFDEKYLSNIFALFERLNAKDKYEGTGIGLAIAKKIIEKHGGLISANSVEGSGAAFNIILPAKPPK